MRGDNRFSISGIEFLKRYSEHSQANAIRYSISNIRKENIRILSYKIRDRWQYLKWAIKGRK